MFRGTSNVGSYENTFFMLQVPSKTEVRPKICNCHYHAQISNSRGSVRAGAMGAIVPVDFPKTFRKERKLEHFLTG